MKSCRGGGLFQKGVHKVLFAYNAKLLIYSLHDSPVLLNWQRDLACNVQCNNNYVTEASDVALVHVTVEFNFW